MITLYYTIANMEDVPVMIIPDRIASWFKLSRRVPLMSTMESNSIEPHHWFFIQLITEALPIVLEILEDVLLYLVLCPSSVHGMKAHLVRLGSEVLKLLRQLGSDC